MTEIEAKYDYDPRVPEHFVKGDTFKEAFPQFNGIVVEYDPVRDLYQMFSTNYSPIKNDKYYLLVVERRYNNEKN